MKIIQRGSVTVLKEINAVTGDSFKPSIYSDISEHYTYVSVKCLSSKLPLTT